MFQTPPTRPPSHPTVAPDSGLPTGLGLSFPSRLRDSGRFSLLFPVISFALLLTINRATYFLADTSIHLFLSFFKNLFRCATDTLPEIFNIQVFLLSSFQGPCRTISHSKLRVGQYGDIPAQLIFDGYQKATVIG